MTAKSLRNLLNSSKDKELGDILQRARDLGALTEALGRALPAEHAAAIVAANVREGGELVVVCRSSAWASRLRFEADTLLDAARATGVAVERCTVRVARRD